MSVSSVSTTQRSHSNYDERSYVYLMLCEEAEHIYIKIGYSDNPIKRLKQITSASALTPKYLATVTTRGTAHSKWLEADLHCAFMPWRITGEWFRFAAADKAEFNLRSRSVLMKHADAEGTERKWKTVPTGVLLNKRLPRRDWLTYVLRSRAFVGAAEMSLPKVY